jgi:hypothetical protein
MSPTLHAGLNNRRRASCHHALRVPAPSDAA